MNETLKIVLSLSLSGALLILILYLLRPLFKGRLSKRWQYYIWLVVVARLLLPFAPEANLMRTLFQTIDTSIAQTDFAVPQGSTSSPTVDMPHVDGVINGQGNTQIEPQEPTNSINNSMQNIIKVVWQNLWLGWVMVALILIIRKITIYQSFVKYIRAGCAEVQDIDLLERFGKLVEKNGVKTVVELQTNNLISSPLLIGFFRPCIVLPSVNLSVIDFEYTILHELTHYKRRDMFYKWLVQLTGCIHWFNPLVYLMGKDIGRICELSCDEAVIRALDPRGRRAYGDTLLNAMGAGGSYKNSLASVTLNESKERLKERLDAIMSFKKTTRVTAAISIVLGLALCFGATAAGAYAATPVNADIQQVSNNKETTIFSEGDGVYYLFYNGATKADMPTISFTPGTIIIVLVEKDGYLTFGPFEKAGDIVSGVTKQCTVLLSQNRIAKDTATWIEQKAKLIEEIEGYTAPTSQPQPQATLFSPDSTGKVVIPISIKTMSENTKLCIGEVPDLANATSIDYNITCDSNDGVLSAELRNPTQDVSYFHVETEITENNKMIQFQFDNSFNSRMGAYESYNGNYQFFIQNKGGTLSAISGNITIQYPPTMVNSIVEPIIYDHQSFGPDVVYRPDENGVLTVTFSIDRIERGQVVCLGQVPCLTNADDVAYHISSKTGKGIFASTSNELKSTAEQYNRAWFMWAPDNTTEGMIDCTFDELRGRTFNQNTGNFYIYVGSNAFTKEGNGTALTDVKGTITIKTYSKN